jgi:hypothetical protein
MMSRPSPGILNTVSMTTAPPIRIASVMPITVSVGMMAFLSACL